MLTKENIKQRLTRHIHFHLSTWTGRLLVINFVFFCLIAASSDSFFFPNTNALIFWGAKDPVLIAKGEWWRFIMPIFLHFGVIHFVLNSLALKVVGSYLEPLVGAFWFLLIYMVSGITGNVLSSLCNVSLGAGASGAIFGLVGLGMLIEQLINKKERIKKIYSGPFTSMAILNILIAFLFNFLSLLADSVSIGIDNAAHIGGLGSGIILGSVMIFLKPNRLISKNYKVGFSILSIFAGILMIGIYIPLYTPRIYNTFIKEAGLSQDTIRSYYFYSNALRINDSDPEIRFKRGKILILEGEIRQAMVDLLFASQYPNLIQNFENLEQELKEKKLTGEANRIKLIIDRMRTQIIKKI